MTLKGNFETFYISTILQLLKGDEKTGVLRIRTEDDSIKVFLEKGDIIFARTSKGKNRIGYLLERKAIISLEQLKECLEIANAEKIALGKVLVTKGYVKKEILNKFIRKQAENIVYDLFFLESGEFDYKDFEFDLKGMVVNRINTMGLILEATRRIDEISIFKKQIPDDKLVLKMSMKVQISKEIKLNTNEWRMVSLINGTSTVRQIISESGFDNYLGYKLLNSLISSGYVEVLKVLSPIKRAEKAFLQLADVDTKIIRERFDDIGLSRSSTIRLSLTRILRDSIGVEELMESVSMEAETIASHPNEIETLRQLKSEKQLSIISNTVTLLYDKIPKSD